jgi:hypothetical protein
MRYVSPTRKTVAVPLDQIDREQLERVCRAYLVPPEQVLAFLVKTAWSLSQLDPASEDFDPLDDFNIEVRGDRLIREYFHRRSRRRPVALRRHDAADRLTTFSK